MLAGQARRPARRRPQFIAMHSALAILLSGGLDSATLLHHLRRTRPGADIHALTFNYGQRHARELECAAWQAAAAGAAAHTVLDLDVLRQLAGAATALIAGAPVPALAELAPAQLDQPPTYVPHRNLVLLALAAAYAEAHGIAEVFYAAQHQDRYGYWDCTEKFLQRANDLLALNRRPEWARRSPRWTKARYCRSACNWAWITPIPGPPLPRGGAQACGVCPACAERLAAFRAAGAADPWNMCAGRQRRHDEHHFRDLRTPISFQLRAGRC